MAENNQIDANKTDTVSSTESEEMGSSQETQTQKAQGDVSNQSLTDFLKDNVPSVKVEGTDDSPTVEGDEQDGDVQKLNKTAEDDPSKKTEEGKEKDGAEKEDGAEEEQDKEKGEEGKDRTAEGRIRELVEQKNEVVKQYEESKPKIDNYNRIDQFCQTNGITPEQFTKAMEREALMNTNPEEALKQLLPLVEKLQGFTGNKLPTDLQEKVDSGKIELSDAKELAQLRAQREFGSKKSQYDQQQLQQSQQAMLQNQMRESFQTWDTTKRASDPDYKPKEKESDPDGKWELVKDKYLALLNETKVVNGQLTYGNPVRSPQEMIALVDRAYTSVSASFKKLNGHRPPTRKVLNSNGSSNNDGKRTIENAKTLTEVAQMVLPGRR